MITYSMKMLGRALTAALVIWASFTACHGPQSSGPDSETHFLNACTADCGGEFQCLCGVCTKPCTTDNACSTLSDHAACVDSCGAQPSKVCDVTCDADPDCHALGDQFRCVAQHCRVPAVVGAGGADAGPAACQAAPTTTPVLPATTQFDPNVVARAGTVLGSCYPSDDGIGRNIAHLWASNLSATGWSSRSMVQADCLANAHCGCGAIEQCTGYSLKTQAPDCKAGCAGQVFTACGPPALDIPKGFSVSIDCSTVGLVCDNEFVCGAAPGVACDGTFTPRCNADGAPEYCSSSRVLHTAACATLGLTCQNGECTGSGATCVNQSSATAFTDQQSIDGLACNGSALAACFNGLTSNVDCASVGPGFSCQSAGGKFFCGLGSECEPASEFSPSPTFPDTCSGNVVTFCNAGRIEHIDCVSLGFTGCQVDRSIGHYGCY